MTSEPPISTERPTIVVLNISRCLPAQQRYFHPDESEWFVSIRNKKGLTMLLFSCGIRHALKLIYPQTTPLPPILDLATANIGDALHSHESLGATTKDNLPELIAYIFELEIARTSAIGKLRAGHLSIHEYREYKRQEEDLQNFCRDLIEDIEYALYLRFERMLSASNDPC